MINGFTVAIIDSNRESRASLEKFFSGLDSCTVAGTAADFTKGFEIISRSKPNIVLLEIDIDKDEAFFFVSRVSRDYPGTGLVAMSKDNSSDTILKTIRSGCAEYLMRPVDQKDLMDALKKLGRFMFGSNGNGEKGKVITCFSPKGGSGCTTVAVNLAACLHKTMEKPVVLVDLDLEGGCADVFLNLRPRYSFADAARNTARLDHAFLQGVLTRHASGIYLLSAPRHVFDAETITPGQIREVLDQLRGMFPYVVIDTAGRYGEKNLAAFDMSDLILLVGLLSLPALSNMQRALALFSRLGYGEQKLKLLANRYSKKGEIQLRDAEKTLGRSLQWQLPEALDEIDSSINRGQPLVALYPASEAARQFLALAKQAGTALTANAAVAA